MKIINIIVKERNKQGQPYIDKFTGKPQAYCSMTFEGDSEWRGGFIKDVEFAKKLKQGDDLDVILFENKSPDGKVFKNFKIATQKDKDRVEIEDLKKRVKTLEDFIKKLINYNGLKY